MVFFSTGANIHDVTGAWFFDVPGNPDQKSIFRLWRTVLPTTPCREIVAEVKFLQCRWWARRNCHCTDQSKVVRKIWSRLSCSEFWTQKCFLAALAGWWYAWDEQKNRQKSSLTPPPRTSRILPKGEQKEGLQNVAQRILVQIIFPFCSLETLVRMSAVFSVKAGKKRETTCV